MILLPHPQGSREWHEARCGVLTGSLIDEAIGVVSRGQRIGQPTAASEELAGTLAIERITRRPYRGFAGNEFTREGQAEEPMARIAYEAQTGTVVDEAGLILTEDGRFGYSTDGLVRPSGLLEVKTLVSPRRIAEFIGSPDKRGWALEMFGGQCRHGLWITGAPWLDLLVWIPALEDVGKHYWCYRIDREEDRLAEHEDAIWRFARRVDSLEALFRAPDLNEAIAQACGGRIPTSPASPSLAGCAAVSIPDLF